MRDAPLHDGSDARVHVPAVSIEAHFSGAAHRDASPAANTRTSMPERGEAGTSERAAAVAQGRVWSSDNVLPSSTRSVVVMNVLLASREKMRTSPNVTMVRYERIVLGEGGWEGKCTAQGDHTTPIATHRRPPGDVLRLVTASPSRTQYTCTNSYVSSPRIVERKELARGELERCAQ